MLNVFDCFVYNQCSMFSSLFVSVAHQLLNNFVKSLSLFSFGQSQKYSRWRRMKKILASICFVICLNFVYSYYDLRVNERCNAHTGQQGICKDARNCGSFQADRNRILICSFQGRIPIVCCPLRGSVGTVINAPPPTTTRQTTTTAKPKRISASKCDRYAELIYAPPVSRRKRSPKKSPSDQFGNNNVTFVGGIKAEYNEFPHMTAIGWRRDNTVIDWLCGGSLISENFVLTAAHCASVGREPPDVVRIGDQDLTVNEDSIAPQEIDIKAIIVHPEYKHTLKYHDLALFELVNPITISKNVCPACLRQSLADPSGAVEAMGYGQTSFAGIQSNALLKGFLTVVNNAECSSAYSEESSDLPQGITQQQLCAWDPEGNKDTCQGDSGGPLQTTKRTLTSNKKYYEIVGVTSFGKLCAAGVPGVYVRVASYLDWIESVVWPQTQ
ncbi:hypothetical protein ACKWTF_013750 [Chironomus riparius]